MPHPVDIHVGKRLRLRRTLLGYSQEHIGNAIGITFQQIQKYERGVNRIGASRLYQLASILTVPVSYFFEEYEAQSDYMTPTPDYSLSDATTSDYQHEDITSSRESIDLLRNYYKIPDKATRKSIVQMIKSVASNTDKS